MATIFQQLAKSGRKQGIQIPNTQNARNWFRNAAQNITRVSSNRLMNDKQNIKNKISVTDVGKMVMFLYDPKHKNTLPYYDTFPLIFIIGFKNGGFMGINLHYLPPFLRAKLMDALYSTLNNQQYNDTTKLKISYEILSGATRFKYFKPCIKQYLWNHVGSNFLNVPPKMWDAALFLPTARFQKANQEQIWQDSENLL